MRALPCQVLAHPVTAVWLVYFHAHRCISPLVDQHATKVRSGFKIGWTLRSFELYLRNRRMLHGNTSASRIPALQTGQRVAWLAVLLLLPLGGLSFMIGWFLLAFSIPKK